MSASVQEVQRTTCCVVGGGPAGAVLTLLLARRGVPVTLLEAHDDFDRDFRGDTIHPSVLTIFDEIGLADSLLKLPHTRLERVQVQTAAGTVPLADLRALKARTKYPFIAMMPQTRFLEFVTREAARYPHAQVLMGATVQELVERDGVVRGVRYRTTRGWHEVAALLTVGSDGRFSRLRHLAGLPAAIKTAAPMDVLWFRLPRDPAAPPGVSMGRLGRGHLLIQLDRGDLWQLGYVIPKGAYHDLHAAGLGALKRSVAETAPDLARSLDALTDWKQVSLLSVASDRLPRWYRPGLLLLGDAAHVMSPAGGNGINYAIMDAVAAANILGEPLRRGRLSQRDLRAVQRRREWPTRVIQAVVSAIQDRFISAVLDPTRTVALPPIVRLGAVRDLLGQVVAIGIRPEHVRC